MKKLLLFLIVISPVAVADTPFDSGWVAGVAVSFHSNDAFADGYAAENTNNIHPVVGWQNDEAGAYAFINTYGDFCVTAGKRWVKDFYQFDQVTLAGEAYLGGVIGYDDKLPNFAGVSAYGRLGLNLEWGRHYLSLQTAGNVSLIGYGYKIN